MIVSESAGRYAPPAMHGPITADQTGAIHAKHHWQILQANIVMNAVVSALEKRRVYGDERLISLRRQASSKRHTMLLRNSHIEGAIWKCFGKNVDASAARHCSCDGDNPIILLSFFHETFAEYFCV